MNITKLKIGLVAFHSFAEPGGVKHHVQGLAQEFKKLGIETKIIVPRRSWFEHYGPDVILLGTSFSVPFNASKGDVVVNFNPIALRKTLEREKFDILHFHNFGFPSVLEILSFSKATHILTFHADLEDSELIRNFPAFSYFFPKLVEWRVEGVIGVSERNLELFKDYKGLKRVIPNGVDLEHFNPNNKPFGNFKDNKLNILFVGRLEERKGLIYLLRAFELLKWNNPNIRLLIIGKGELRSEAGAFVRSRNLKDVHFLGEKTGEELARWYATSDIFCSPATHAESFGIVLLEAMATGLPVVGFANKGYALFMQNKKGKDFFASPKDVEGLAKHLQTFISDPNLRKEMGEWGIEAAKRYGWDIVGKEVLDFYQEVLNLPKRP
ncbi:MAG: glycosyltransferase family 4 protein [Patescibacteria group bacterium]|nr:glycosyltransferase family 4 protein [Patescibacteria group bacterium]